MKDNISLIIYLVLSLLIPELSQSQELIKFDEKVHDFGTFNEDDDSPSHSFRFVNSSKRPIAISHVSSTCGCTAAEYTKTPVLPGKEGYIIVTYNPKGRPGNFNRTVKAFIANSETPVVLTIKGSVTAGSERKYSGYAYVMGQLQLRNNTAMFSPLPGLKQSEVGIMVINSGEQTLNISFQSNSPAIAGKAIPQILRPDEKGEINVTYSTDQPLNGQERLYVILNGKKDEKNFIRILYKQD